MSGKRVQVTVPRQMKPLDDYSSGVAILLSPRKAQAVQEALAKHAEATAELNEVLQENGAYYDKID